MSAAAYAEFLKRKEEQEGQPDPVVKQDKRHRDLWKRQQELLKQKPCDGPAPLKRISPPKREGRKEEQDIVEKTQPNDSVPLKGESSGEKVEEGEEYQDLARQSRRKDSVCQSSGLSQDQKEHQDLAEQTRPRHDSVPLEGQPPREKPQERRDHLVLEFEALEIEEDQDLVDQKQSNDSTPQKWQSHSIARKRALELEEQEMASEKINSELRTQSMGIFGPQEHCIFFPLLKNVVHDQSSVDCTKKLWLVLLERTFPEKGYTIHYMPGSSWAGKDVVHVRHEGVLILAIHFCRPTASDSQLVWMAAEGMPSLVDDMVPNSVVCIKALGFVFDHFRCRRIINTSCSQVQHEFQLSGNDSDRRLEEMHHLLKEGFAVHDTVLRSARIDKVMEPKGRDQFRDPRDAPVHQKMLFGAKVDEEEEVKDAPETELHA